MTASAQKRPAVPTVERMVKNLTAQGIAIERIVQETTPSGAVRVYVRDENGGLPTLENTSDWSNAPSFV